MVEVKVPGNFAKGQLKSFVQRIERLSEERKALSDDIREVFAEAKGGGFDTKALREIVRLRKQDPAERAEHEALVDLYREALGMLSDTPLGEAAIRTAKAGQNGKTPKEVKDAADRAEKNKVRPST